MPQAIPKPHKEDFDTTPEISFDSQGKARLVRSFYIWNDVDLGHTDVMLKSDGEYMQHCYDPEHGGPNMPWDVEKSWLEHLADRNPRSVPEVLVLGRTREEVDAILAARNIRAKYVTLPADKEKMLSR